MQNEKLSELTKVTTLPDTALLYGVDGTRSEGDKSVSIDVADAKILFGSLGTQDLEDVIAQDPVATSMPTFEGGITVGASGSGFISLGGPNGLIFENSVTGMLFGSTPGLYTLTKRPADPESAQIVSISPLGYNVQTNNLNLANTDVGMDGFECVVEVAGTRNFGSGNIVLGVGDVLANNGSIYYKKVDNNQSGGSETATYSATSTAVTTLDCNTFDSRYQILTVNTDIQWSNTPASGESFVKTLEVIGAFSLSFSTSTKIIGTYNDDGSTVNIITVNFANYPTVGLRTTVMINQ